MAAGEGVVPIAGATDLLVHWPTRQGDHDRTYLDLSRVAEIKPITWTPDALVLGAMTTYWDVLQEARCVKEFGLLGEAARQVGAVQIQSRGTWAGNIANASPAADGVPVLMAYDAVVTLACVAGTRDVALDEFYLGYRKTVRRPDELIVSISIPRRVYDLETFHKVGPRRAQAVTKVGLAITHASGGGALAWRVVANSVAPTVRRCPTIEKAMSSGSPITTPDGFLPSADADVTPIDDIRSTAQYRRTVLCRLLYHSLRGKCPSVV